MYVKKRSEIDKKSFNTDTMKNVQKQVLIGGAQGWESHVMRMFTLGRDGFSPKHNHPWDHMVYIVKGEGLIHIDGTDYPVTGDSVAFVPGGTEHQFLQSGKDELVFMCIVPTEGDV